MPVIFDASSRSGYLPAFVAAVFLAAFGLRCARTALFPSVGPVPDLYLLRPDGCKYNHISQ
jgi:hypothetical protein